MATIKRALISVSDKTGILEFAQGLREMGVDILSTGGTAKLLSENAVELLQGGGRKLRWSLSNG